MEQEVQKADPEARRKILLLIVVITIVGVAAIQFIQANEPVMEQWLEDNLDLLLEKPYYALVAGFIIVLPLELFGIYLFVVGRKIMVARRFPLPGEKVIRDTKVLIGDRAAVRGRMMQLLAILLMGAATVLPVSFWLILRSLGDAIQ